MHWLDRAFYAALPRLGLFSRGWGDPRVLQATPLLAIASAPPARLSVELGPARRAGGARGAICAEGAFTSPEQRLPGSARRARFRLLLPPGEAAGICVYLASSGDEGFGMRTRLAAPLLARGLGALVLENAFYGRRRGPGQRSAAVQTVSDLVLMASATVQEARGLAAWLRARGAARVGVAGYSMGGSMTALAGATLPFPAALVPMAAAATPATVFCEGLLSRHVAWGALSAGGEAEGRRELSAFLRRSDVRQLPPPATPAAAIVVETARDGVVAPSDMRAIAAHWPGCELRTLDAGHVSAVLVHLASLRRAVADAFQRLPPP